MCNISDIDTSAIEENTQNQMFLILLANTLMERNKITYIKKKEKAYIRVILEEKKTANSDAVKPQ